ncbi:MAG TPA: type I DNA topoisomerase [Aggregatilineales bacterium]|nr:type I DNA topoisomerase [Aggregatilineales bacterium]
MKLVIVESPAKARQIASYLGDGWQVEACRGHVNDLPDDALGVDVDANFRPTYRVLPGKGNLVKRLLKAIREAEAIYVATDPDREGEAIAWHLLKLARIGKSQPVYRAAFHAITKTAVRDAIAHPRPLDLNLVEAQTARRIVDRLVGYLASPLAAKALVGRFSAGRVQSVCLRLVVEREREIANFTPQTYWTLALDLTAHGVPFTAKLHQVKGAEPSFSTREPLDKLAALLGSAQLWVGRAGKTTRQRPPLPPFTTAALQQAAAKGLGLSPERTMNLAQTLYEAGWITYHRTDGVAVAPEAQASAREYIERAHGTDYLPAEAPIYTARSINAQEAHEAIRPTDVNRIPNDPPGDGEGAALYGLIWQRFVASQMAAAVYSVTGAQIYAGKQVGQPYPLEFRTQGRTLQFEGFLRVYEEPGDEDEDTPSDSLLPDLHEGQILTLVTPQIAEHETRAPARYTEAALIAALERNGVGRPSTYATMLKTVRERGYVRLQQKRLIPTDEGIRLSDFLNRHFNAVLAVDYTARLEAQLDAVALGKITRLDVLREFWSAFQPQLIGAAAALPLATAPTPRPLLLHPVED